MEADKETQLASFMSIAGCDADTAKQYLEITNWSMDEAVNLFMEGGVDNQSPAHYSSTPSSATTSMENQMLPSESVGTAPTSAEPSVGSAYIDPDGIRAPDPSRRQQLMGGIGASGMYSGQARFINDAFRDIAQEGVHSMFSSSMLHTTNGSAGSSSAGMDIDSLGGIAPPTPTLATMFQPPLQLLFRGSFDDAKRTAKQSGKWLLVNIQDAREFASSMLNRDTWSNDLVQGIVASSFIFWQVDQQTNGGSRYCTLYHISSADLPHISIIDPRTGEKKTHWTGFLEPEGMAEKLSDFCGQNDLIGNGRPSKKPSFKPIDERDTKSSHGTQIMDQVDIMDQSEDAQLAAAIAASLDEKSSSTADTKEEIIIDEDSDEEKQDEEQEQEGEQEEEIILPDEPADNHPNATRVQIRCADGTRVKRKFFKSDPVLHLFKFVKLTVPEAKNKPFELRTAFPPKALTDDETSLEEAKLTNASINMQWM